MKSNEEKRPRVSHKYKETKEKPESNEENIMIHDEMNGQKKKKKTVEKFAASSARGIVDQAQESRRRIT